MSYNFAFLVHPRGLKDVYNKFPFLKIFPEAIVGYILKRIKPVLVSKITGLRDVNGEEITGLVVSIPITAKMILEDRDMAIKKINEAIRILENKEIKYVGLGALTASVTHGGLRIKRDNIQVTTGRAYTVKTVTDYVVKVVELMSLDRNKITIAIVGAAGSIGGGCLKILEEYGFKNFILIDIERKLDNIDKPKCSKYLIDHRISEIKNADIIITATSSPEAILRSEDLRPGSIIINDAQPSDIGHEIAQRDDVLAIEGGVVNTPNISSNFPMGIHGKDNNFCCLAEVLVLAHNQINDDFSTGYLNLEKIKHITDLSSNMDFEISRFQNSIEGYISTEKINKVRKILEDRYN